MEESISTFCKSLASFCKHLQTSSQSLKDSVDRRPIPLDSAASTFIQGLNRRMSLASADVNVLESMVLGTVSFEELLGHCNEALKKNQQDIALIEDRLVGYGYVPDLGVDDENMDLDLVTPGGVNMKYFGLEDESDSPSLSNELIGKKLTEDPIFDDSISIQDLGLSEVCLATLASEANDELVSPKTTRKLTCYTNAKPYENTSGSQPLLEALGVAETINMQSITKSNQPILGGAAKEIIKISKDEFDKLPSYLKTLVSWEDLQAVVVKMNSILPEKVNPNEGNSLNQDDIASLDLGSKGRSYLLILLRTNKLLVETVDGSIIYRVVDALCK